MTRTVIALALVALLVGCSSDSEPSDAPAPSETPSPTVTSSASPAAAPNPIRFFDTGSMCVQIQNQQLLTSEDMTVRRPVTLTGVELQALSGGIEVGRATYVAVPKGEVILTGGWRGSAPEKKVWDRIGWLDRKPLAGATLQPGTYYLYLPIHIHGTGGYDGTSVTWTDESGSGSSLLDVKYRYREHCR